MTRTPFTATAPDGTRIPLRWYSPHGADDSTADSASRGPAAGHAHGGGMIAGSVDGFDRDVAAYVAAPGVPILSVEYRLAPEAHGTTPAEDVHAGLAWLVEHAGELGVDPQLLPTATWTYDDNRTGWGALLGDDLGAATVSPVAAPARLTDFTGLPPAYLEVGDLDIFRDEVIAHARGLLAAGVPVELHVHRGAVHGFDQFALDADVTRRALADRARVLRSL